MLFVFSNSGLPLTRVFFTAFLLDRVKNMIIMVKTMPPTVITANTCNAVKYISLEERLL